MKRRIAWYITGHGYGHAVRSIEIIKELFLQQPGVAVQVRTSAASWLFAELQAYNFTYHNVKLDIGALQSNSYHVLQEETLAAYAELITRKKSLLQQEVNFLTQEKIDMVVSDITPLAFEAAAALGLPSIGEGNFTWDWIYSDWLSSFPPYRFVIDDIRSSYHCADLLLRLPFYGDMSAFHTIVDVPLVARRSRLTRDQAASQLGKQAAIRMKSVLLGLRPADIEHVPLDTIAQLQGYQFITTSPTLRAPNIISIPEGRSAFQDLLKACDAVISKPGYSMVAEIIANQTPLLYVSRSDFCEDPVLRQALHRYAVCRELPIQDFRVGCWQKQLDQLFTMDRTWPAIAVDGAEVAAAHILSYNDKSAL
jgi:hypothetical protein